MPFIDTDRNTDIYVSNIAQKPEVIKTVFMNDISLDTMTEGVTAEERQISQAIFNVLLTLKSERIFNLNFGSNIFRYLFQPATSYTISALETEIRESILAVEKRIIIKPGDVSADTNPDEHYIDISITYKIKSTSEFGNWSNRLYL